jgi:hypothetical protein
VYSAAVANIATTLPSKKNRTLATHHIATTLPSEKTEEAKQEGKASGLRQPLPEKKIRRSLPTKKKWIIVTLFPALFKVKIFSRIPAFPFTVHGSFKLFLFFFHPSFPLQQVDKPSPFISRIKKVKRELINLQLFRSSDFYRRIIYSPESITVGTSDLLLVHFSVFF